MACITIGSHLNYTYNLIYTSLFEYDSVIQYFYENINSLNVSDDIKFAWVTQYMQLIYLGYKEDTNFTTL